MGKRITVVDSRGQSSVELKDRLKRTRVNVTNQTIIRAEETNEITKIIESTRVEGPAARGLKDLGWRFYQDSRATEDDPLILPAGVRMQLPVDGKGLLSAAFGTPSDTWLDPLSAKFYPDALGDFFFYRVNLTVWPSVNNKTFVIDFDIGTANRVFEQPTALTHGAGFAHKISTTIPIGVSSSMVTNGGTINVLCEADAMISRVSVLALKSYSVTG